jgi:hypothetical protein
MNDPVDQFLETDFTGPAPQPLHQTLLAQTTRLLQRRGRWRRLAWAGALAACFLAGMVTMALWRPAEPDLQETQRPAPRDIPQPPEKSEPEKPTPELPASLVDLEWHAFDSRDNRATLFFQVGRRYLEEQNDLDGALRCYRQALDAAPQEELAIRPDDNWLVMALKEARQKEKNDAALNP